MPSILTRVIFAATALAPAGLFYAWAAYIDETTLPALGWVILVISLVTIVVFNFLLSEFQWFGEQSDFEYISVESANHETFSFLLIYLSPLFTAGIGAMNWQIWLPIVVVFIIVSGAGNSFYYNPLMHLFGWNFYKVGCEGGIPRILITKKTIKKSTGSTTIIELSNVVILDVEED